MPPSGTPPDGRIVVPDLTGLTPEEAAAQLGDQLTLDTRGDEGTVQEQIPAPGTLVEPASAVTVVLAPDGSTNLAWLLVPAVLVLALAGGLAAKQAHQRRVREERWLDEQVRTETVPRVAALSGVPRRPVRGVDLRLEVHRHPARL